MRVKIDMKVGDKLSANTPQVFALRKLSQLSLFVKKKKKGRYSCKVKVAVKERSVCVATGGTRSVVKKQNQRATHALNTI